MSRYPEAEARRQWLMERPELLHKDTRTIVLEMLDAGFFPGKGIKKVMDRVRETKAWVISEKAKKAVEEPRLPGPTL